MRYYFLFFLIIVCIFFQANNFAYSNYLEAKKAYEEDKWEKSIKICSSLSQEDPRCDNLIGVLFLKGLGRKKDFGKAFFYFNKASKRGHKLAYKNLAWMYSAGLGVQKDLEKASRLLRLSETKQVVLKKEINENLLINSINKENKNIAVFRSYFSKYQKFQILLKFYDINENHLNLNISKINKNIKELEENINLEYEEKSRLKNEIIEEQKIVLKLLSLSIKNGSTILEDEIKIIYTKLYSLATSVY